MPEKPTCKWWDQMSMPTPAWPHVLNDCQFKKIECKSCCAVVQKQTADCQLEQPQQHHPGLRISEQDHNADRYRGCYVKAEDFAKRFSSEVHRWFDLLQGHVSLQNFTRLASATRSDEANSWWIIADHGWFMAVLGEAPKRIEPRCRHRVLPVHCLMMCCQKTGREVMPRLQDVIRSMKVVQSNKLKATLGWVCQARPGTNIPICSCGLLAGAGPCSKS